MNPSLPIPSSPVFRLIWPDYNHAEGGKEYTFKCTIFWAGKGLPEKILNIKMVDDFFIIAYFPGFDAADKEASFTNKSPEEATNFWKGMREKYPHRIAVFDASGNRLSDFEPKGLIVSSMVLRNGELWDERKAG